MFRFGLVKVAGGIAAGLLIWHASGSMPAVLAAPVEAASSSVVSAVGSLTGSRDALLPGDPTGRGWAAGPAGESAGWRTCRAVPYLVNTGPADPHTARALVAEAAEAFGKVGAAAGMKFVFAGTTTSVPTSTWAHAGVRVPGYKYAPVLVGWVTPSQTDLLASGEWGSTVANPVGSDAARHLVTGAVALDAAALDQLYPGFGQGQTRGNVLLHELGHIAGLGHDAAGGLMDPVVGPQSPDGFSEAELAGLAAIGPHC